MISGKTTLIAHLGYPTEAFQAPMIYNPWFEKQGIDAVVVPMGVKPEDYVAFLPHLFKLTNIRGALVTMPHKITTVGLMDEVSPTAPIAGVCNAILKRPDGTLVGDQFDGAGFVRGVERKGRKLAGARVLVLGSGGVGSPIAASLAAAGVAELAIFDTRAASVEGLASRLREHYPQLVVRTDTKDPAGFDVVVNATPLGMKDTDPLPFDIERITPSTFVGEVVMKSEYTPLLRAAKDKGCAVQVGTDMLFEMVPAYLEFFGYGSASVDDLRAVAQIQYT
ncbi:Shikimate 5-dehydrogenase I alpha [Candidatus Paraburkholderia kirkii UZHbot1]|uniref:Shikimate 5-dehydrogenase I alpha n=1 Tax=Candidatus Paraburkholderia kirkii UZHbot1 TaxID=1055526 RepID=G4MCK3_9BURK|nr:Shikimate 5-dehydrogenase I alpha [Candidatus Paraburkholderia kirkii UZHbot1]